MVLDSIFFKLITEKIKEGIILIDKEATILYSNTHVENILKYSSDEMLNQNLFKLIIKNEDFIENYITEHKKTLENIDTDYTPFEIETQTKYGESIHLELKPNPVKHENKSYNIFSLRNTSEKKHNENEFKEYQEIFYKITNTARDAIIMMDNEAKITYWNPAAEKIFGYKVSEAINNKMHNLIIPAENQYEFTKKFTRFKYTGKGFTTDRTVEAPALRKDGTQIIIDLSVSTVKIKDEWSLIAIIRDITERKKSDEILTDTILKFESIFNAIDAKIYISDENYNITYLDNSLNKYEVITEKTQKCYKFLFGLDSPCPWCKIKKVLGGSGISIGYEILNPKNKNWYYIFSSPTELNNQKAMITVIHDIQEIKTVAGLVK